jgi:hypothetical protein
MLVLLLRLGRIFAKQKRTLSRAIAALDVLLVLLSGKLESIDIARDAPTDMRT